MKRLLLPLALLAWSAPAVAQTPAAPPPFETPAQHDARMKWWREARFGMFVHWGLFYSGLAGTWEGKPVGASGAVISTTRKRHPIIFIKAADKGRR